MPTATNEDVLWLRGLAARIEAGDEPVVTEDDARIARDLADRIEGA